MLVDGIIPSSPRERAVRAASSSAAHWRLIVDAKAPITAVAIISQPVKERVSNSFTMVQISDFYLFQVNSRVHATRGRMCVYGLGTTTVHYVLLL